MTEPREETKVTLSFEDALEVAVTFHRNGRLQEAEMVYRALREKVFDHPDLEHYWGVLCHQLGRSEEGLEAIRRALVVAPDLVDARNNLGNVLQEIGRPAEAAAVYRDILEANPGHEEAWNNLGVALKAAGDLDAAEAAFRRAIAIRPSSAEAWHNLGNVLERRERAAEAIEAFRRSLALEPRNRVAYRYLAEALAREGRIDEAKRVFDEWFAFEPGSESARHIRAAVLGGEAPSRAPDGYVTVLFDALADEFDAKLASLEYRAPALVAAAVEAAAGDARALEILDAGCGTGLCGTLLRPVARRLVGVDLSIGMLRLASGRKAYDELSAAELTGYLASERGAFDAVVSADTLVYFGDLGPVAHAAFGALRPGGFFVFTVERLADDPAGTGWVLHPHGRYAHTNAYVVSTLTAAGFSKPEIRVETLRLERGEPVPGLVVTAFRPAPV